MKNDYLADWARFLASPAASAIAMSPLQLEGFLTGLIVAPDLTPPSSWIEALWNEDGPLCRDTDQLQAVLDGVTGYYNTLLDIIDKEGADWLPMFMDGNRKANLVSAGVWVQGFWQAMTFVPDAWAALMEDERTYILVEPFAAFVDLGSIDNDLTPIETNETRHHSASLIPHVLPELRKIAQLRR